MKVDLDKHERIARAAKYSESTRYFVHPDLPREVVWVRTIDGRDTCVPQSHADCFRAVDAEHIAANSPPVTLAFIARIRELEAALSHAGTTLDSIDNSGASETVMCHYEAAAIRALLAKGVVIQ